MTGDYHEFEWTGVDAVRRRVVFEPRSVGGHTRIEQRHNGSEWVTVGNEIVSGVEVEDGAELIA